MKSLNIDKVIIEFVLENHCLYDKRDVDFRNIKKRKDLWQKISENLKTFYKVKKSAKQIEKRWSSLRDMFSRENRRQKLLLSDSNKPKKEWKLYRNMLFLIPHLTPRRAKTSFVQQNQSQNLLLQTSTTNTFSPSKQSSNSIISPPSDHNYSGSFQLTEETGLSLDIKSKENITIDKEIENGLSLDIKSEENITIGDESENRLLLDIKNEENIITIDNEIENGLSLDIKIEENFITNDNEILNRSANTFSSYSNINNIQFLEPNTSFNSINLENSSTFKSIEKIMPEMDRFAKYQKNKDDQIDRYLVEANKELSAIVKAVPSQVFVKKCCEKDGYMFAIEEGLKYVPSRNKTQCIIEVLQIIQKYEERQ